MAHHPLKDHNVKELLIELRKRVDQKLIYEKIDGDLSLFTYANECQQEKKWDLYTKSSRGLIIDTKEEKIVALPFSKFFNHTEEGIPLPTHLSFEIYEKVDGSLIILYNHKDKWRCATKGSFNSDQAIWAEKWFNEEIRDKSYVPFLPGRTYLFEAIYPENQIVVNYKGWKGLVLLGAYEENGDECDYKKLKTWFDGVPGMRTLNNLLYSNIDELVNVCKSLPKDQEGFVILFEDGYRVKLKGDEYLRVHRLLSSVTPLRIWEMMYNKDNMEVVRTQLPEEFLKDFDAIISIYNNQFTSILSASKNIYASIDPEIFKIEDQRLMKKRYAEEVFKKVKQGNESSVLFSLRNGKSDEEIRLQIWKSLRPRNNVLDGYIPSRLMNLFEE